MNHHILLEGKTEVNHHLRLSVFAMLAESEHKDVRATGYRVLRHQLVDAEGWRKLEDYGLDFYVVRSVQVHC